MKIVLYALLLLVILTFKYLSIGIIGFLILRQIYVWITDYIRYLRIRKYLKLAKKVFDEKYHKQYLMELEKDGK